MENYIGRLLDNRYEILEVIGTGGMAVVYKALCHRLNRLVAIKILKDEYSRDLEFRRRFHAESQAVAMLSHPNIVSVYDVSRSGEVDYIVMELIEGISLKQYLERKGALNWRETLHFSMQIAKALDHAHSRGIIHRDIKPHNIMILKDGSIKVADFGIARIASAQNTLTREALGSVHYISPEQAKGARVDNRSDLYSLGVVMYEMLTGRTPYDGETPVAVAIQHINGGAALPGTFVDGIPRGLEQITMHAMTANADERYGSAAEMLHDMEEFRKNPAMLFHWGAEAPARVSATPTEAERYAAARTARRTSPATAEERRAERARREAAIAEEKRKRTMLIVIVSAAAVALIAVAIVVAVLVGGRGGAHANPETTNGIADVGNVIVPDFVGDRLDSIDPASYPELIIDVDGATFEYDDHVEKGVVIEQDPKSGTEVKGGKVRTVKLVVSLGKESTEMPNLVGQTDSSALSQLTAMNLGLKTVTQEEASETVPAGYVVRTEPAAGTPLVKEQAVTVYVSLGSNKMPDLKWQTKENAGAMLVAMGLNLKAVYLEEEDDEVTEGYVIRTEPAAESDLSKGQQIRVYISTGDGKIAVPQVLGFDKMDAIDLLREAGLAYEVNELYDAEVAEGKVISQSELPNTRVEKDTVIVIDVSKGPEPTEPPTTEPPTTAAPTAAPTEEPTEPERSPQSAPTDESGSSDAEP